LVTSGLRFRIQGIGTSVAHSASYLYLSPFPWRALAAAAVGRPHPTSPPLFWGREVPNKKSPVASGMAFGHFGVGVGVVKVAVWCKHYMSEI
jgi:hypothetical protein